MEALARIGAFDQAALSTIVTIRGVQGDIEEMVSGIEPEREREDPQLTLPFPSGEAEKEQGETGAAEARARQYWDDENHLVEVQEVATGMYASRDELGREIGTGIAVATSRELAQRWLDDHAEDHNWPERKRYVVAQDRFVEVVSEADGFHARYLDNRAEVAELPMSAYAWLLQSALDALAVNNRWQECFCPLRVEADRPCPACRSFTEAPMKESKSGRRKSGKAKKAVAAPPSS
jgi:hypothetical protein